MTFLAPAFLWGLLALAVPIIVHFFYLRRAKKYEFSRAALVERLRQASRPYLRLRHWILLALRLFVVAVIVMAFARPKVGQKLSPDSGGASILVIWDVSPSMTPAFEQARALLTEILRQAPLSYEYRLLTTDSYLPAGGFVSARLLLERLPGVRPASMGYPIVSFLERAEILFTGAAYADRRIYIVSDFQRSSVGDLTRLREKAPGEIILIPVSTAIASNAFIDSLVARREGGQWRLHFRLQGESGRPYAIRIGERSRSLLPGTYEETLPLSATQVELVISGDGVDFDNRVVAGLQDPYESRVGWSIPPGEAFVRLHHLLGITPVTVRKQADWQTLSTFIGDLHLLPTEIGSWVAGGGTLITFPPADLSPAAWQKAFFSAGIPFPRKQITAEPLTLRPAPSPFWEGVFSSTGTLPAYLAEPLSVRTVYVFQMPAGRPLLLDEGGTALLWEVPVGRGRVYLFAFPWKESQLGNHSLFVPLFARLYAWGERVNALQAVEAGKRQILQVMMPVRPRLRHITTGTEYIPPAEKKGAFWQFSFGDQPLPLGLYEIRDEQRTYGTVGLNVSVEESRSPVISPDTWEAAGLTVRILNWENGQLTEKVRGTGWKDWHLWVLLALVLLAVETYWARRLLRPAPLTVPSP